MDSHLYLYSLLDYWFSDLLPERPRASITIETGNLSIQGNLAVMSAYIRSPTRAADSGGKIRETQWGKEFVLACN